MSALARIKKTAAQHEQERQYDKALALYARILDGAEAVEEEVDVGLFNRAGDLALRVGDPARAVGYFERALDLYAAGGLLSNAIALGVKILRHAPNHLSAHYTLGVLYGRRGFVRDARHHLLTYAVQMQRAGRADEAARVLAEVAATCGSAAELRAAYDSYGALGGDPAQAASLDAGAAPAEAAAPATEAAPAPDALDFLDQEPFDAGQPWAAQPAGVQPAAGPPAAEPAAIDDLLPVGAFGGPAAESASDLVFLDVPAEPAFAPPPVAAADVVAFAAVGAPPAPAWAFALPSEPPPLRLADLADVAGPRPAFVPDLVSDPTPAPTLAPTLAPVPVVADVPGRLDEVWAPAEGAPGRFADLLAVELAPPTASVPAAPADEDGLDLGAWLRETTPAESTRMTTAAVPQSGDEQADFDAALRAFTAGVARAVDHEDYDSHHDLGVAFREMGLVDEAIVQFQRAAQAPGRPLRTLEALAQCFLDVGQPELALSALAAPVAAADAAGAGDAALVGVHYLMGSAAQALGRPDDARRWLVRVVATDVRFRDASQRLAALPPPTPIR